MDSTNQQTKLYQDAVITAICSEKRKKDFFSFFKKFKSAEMAKILQTFAIHLEIKPSNVVSSLLSNPAFSTIFDRPNRDEQSQQ